MHLGSLYDSNHISLAAIMSGPTSCPRDIAVKAKKCQPAGGAIKEMSGLMIWER